MMLEPNLRVGVRRMYAMRSNVREKYSRLRNIPRFIQIVFEYFTSRPKPLFFL